MFVGRDRELELLKELFQKKSASLVVCRGRRRIGKSTLIQEFGKTAGKFLEFQGLPPRMGMTNQKQLDSFARQITKQTQLPMVGISSWADAFNLLNSVIEKKSTVLFLDEISWMAEHDKDFAGELKIAWDTIFKKHNQLVVVLCGSVSSWIEKNILHNAGFVGRISLDIHVQELSLESCNKFWKTQAKKISTIEKLKVLTVTGGVPRYLEEIRPTQSAEHNIKRLCFQREGLLYKEFDKIFFDIFAKRGETYHQIVRSLAKGKKSIQELCKDLDIQRGGVMSEYLNDLVMSGFIQKDYTYQPGKKCFNRSIKYRLSDNYLRFFLRCIEPNQHTIEQGLYADTPLEDIINWDILMGGQFENLVLANLPSLLKHLRIHASEVMNASPYYQQPTKRKHGCQIDLLIQTRHTIYPCEIKFRRQIDGSIIEECKKRFSTLQIPKGISIRPVLIYAGKLASVVKRSAYFNNCIDFAKFME